MTETLSSWWMTRHRVYPGITSKPEAYDAQSIIDKIKFVPFTPYTIVSKDDLLKELDSIRQKGYATENRELGEFTFCYGVPVFDHKGNVIASISLSDIALSDQDASEIVADLKAAASEISKTADYTLR